MRGGEEDPCISRDALLVIQKDPERICPRIDLSLDNLQAGEIAWIAVKLGGDHPLFRMTFDLHTSEMDAESRLLLFYRILGAVSDKGVAARIKAERERASRNKD